MRLQRFLKEILCTPFQCKSPKPVSIPPSHIALFLRGESCSTIVLLYKHLHVYFDPSRARFYNLSIKGGTHFIFTIYVFPYVFTAFVFIYLISSLYFKFLFYLLLNVMRVYSVSFTVHFVVLQLHYCHEIIH